MELNKLLSKFDELISEATSIVEERENNIRTTGQSIISGEGYYKVLSSTKALFDYLNSSIYDDMLKECWTQNVNPSILLGVLKSAKREFQFGILNHPKIIATADSMEDLLEQADYLLEQDYKDAACVLIGGVLEGTLRSMLEHKYPSIVFNPKDGLRKFNELLHRRVAAYDKATFKLIDGYAELRNFAAHGDYGRYTKDQVREFCLFTRNFISNWFAVKLSVSDI
jgi:hypothetical protein